MRNAARSENMLARMAQLPLWGSFNKDFRIWMKVLLALLEKDMNQISLMLKDKVKRRPIHFLWNHRVGSNRGSVITRGVAVSTGKSAKNLKVDYLRNLTPAKFNPSKVCTANITIRFGTSFTLHIQINIITSQQHLWDH